MFPIRKLMLLSMTSACLALSACGGGGGSSGSGNSNNSGSTGGEQTSNFVPNALVLEAVSQQQINLDWTSPHDTAGLSHYLIYQDGILAGSASFSEFSATGLNPSTEYCFSIVAVYESGDHSPSTAMQCATTHAALQGSWTTVRSGSPNSLAAITSNGSQILVAEQKGFNEFFLNPNVQVSSDDGKNWSRYRSTGSTFDEVVDVIWGNNEYLAIDGGFYSSADGVNWQYAGPSGGTPRAVAWSPSLSLYVAVGDAGYISTSSDGETWTELAPSPTADDMKSVAWLDGRFIATGASDAIFYSDNGTDWTQATTPDLNIELLSVAWNGATGAESVYVALGTASGYISADGVMWTAIANPPSTDNYAVAWGGGTAGCFATIGWSNNLFVSFDGENWTRAFRDTAPYYAQGDLLDVTSTGSALIAVGSGGNMIRSEDCSTWEIVESGADLNAVTHDGTRFVAVGAAGRIVTSTNAETWNYTYAGDDTYYFHDVLWDGSSYFFGGQTVILSSDDLAEFNVSHTGSTSHSYTIVWDGNQYVKVTGGIYAWDGSTYHTGGTDPWWKPVNFSDSSAYMVDIVWTGSAFAAVGLDGRIFTSPDASPTSTWTERASGTSTDLNAIADNGAGTLVAVGDDGTVLSSIDGGATWTTQPTGLESGEHLYNVAWTGSKFVAVGRYSAILTSSNGTTWDISSEPKLGAVNLNGIGFSGGTIVVVGNNGTIMRNVP